MSEDGSGPGQGMSAGYEIIDGHYERKRPTGRPARR